MKGAEIRAARKRKGWTQTDLAVAIGRPGSQSYIGAIERDEVNVTVTTLARIATALGLELDVVLAEGRPDSTCPAVA